TRGLRDAGVHVIDVRTVPTPVLYYATTHYGTDGGIQITGSHNPPEYNGLKMMIDGRALWGPAIQRRRERSLGGNVEPGSGDREVRDVLPDCVADGTGRFRLERSFRVAVDCGSGVGSRGAERLLEGIGAEVIPVYCISDGSFPSHH